MRLDEKIKRHLDFLYGKNYDSNIVETIVIKCNAVKNEIKPAIAEWNEGDIILITYGDSIIEEGTLSLKTLKTFMQKWLQPEISTVHILPFFPYSSDDGFSVIDYYKVNPKLGKWEDIRQLSNSFNLMFDLVINHVSQSSEWFTNYLKGISPGKDYFIEVDRDTDFSAVVRPRSLPLLSKFKTVNGDKYLWTTFSSDQIDLNFGNSEVLEKIIDIFLFYFKQGAKIIRLDAIAFLWKEIGTNCLHLPQTHEVVKLLRTIAEYIDPQLVILTETNVPNKENLSYFGNGDEANMVYQFSLPPLLLYTLFSENSKYLTDWAQSLPEIPENCTFFNFTASHDGIGVRPLEGLVSNSNLLKLLEGMKSFGGLISTRKNSGGTDSPYEINITYFDALKGIHSGEDGLQALRFVCSQTIMLALKGIPAFYIHSLLASNNYIEGVALTGMNRTINRKKLNVRDVDEMMNSDNVHSRIFKELKRIMRIRKACSDFNPAASQQIINLGNSFFAISRNNGILISVSNITSQAKRLKFTSLYSKQQLVTDILINNEYSSDKEIVLNAYQTCWLKIKKPQSDALRPNI